jgi:hypothetical protein
MDDSQLAAMEGGATRRKLGLGRLRAITVFVVTLLLVWVVASLIHEMGHGLTAEVMGGRFLWFAVWPGIQIYPRLGQPYEGEWGAVIAKAAYAAPQNWEEWRHGMVLLMGSGVNLLLAALALGCLWLLRPRGWLRFRRETIQSMLARGCAPSSSGLHARADRGAQSRLEQDDAVFVGVPFARE